MESAADATPAVDLEADTAGVTPGRQTVPVTFAGLSYQIQVSKKKTVDILEGISGHCSAGKVTVIMGPSGSGKTTLLDLLAGRKNIGTMQGKILYNGCPVTKKTLRHLCGYVEQFDTLVGELTVAEMLVYHADLKLPTSMSTAQKKARVEEVIATLQLESCRDTVIGSALQRGISGGQLKRVNIALALITRPRVIYLDEPTSGLDSLMANEISAVLRSLARDGRTVISTIHSPSSFAFSQFDDLIMLQSGRLIYAGARAAVSDYFESTLNLQYDKTSSLPEWLVEVTCGRNSTLLPSKISHHQSAEQLRESYTAAAVCKQKTAERLTLERDSNDSVHAKPMAAPSQLRALKTLLQYRMLTHYKSGQFLGPRIGDKIFMATLILSLYWGIGNNTDLQSIQSTAALLYFVITLCGYGAAAFVPSITLERPLYYRELADGCYSPMTYYAFKFIEEAVLAILTSLAFALIVFFACSLQGSFAAFWLVYYVTTMTGICLAYGVAAIVPTMEAANALLPAYVTVCMYFGGLFLLFDKIPVYWEWFSWTSFLRYSWGAMMNNQFRDSSVGNITGFANSNGRLVDVLEFYAIEGPVMGSFWACTGFLAMLTLSFAMCGACSLKHMRHSRR